jgi:hypothetical protein
MKVMVPLLSEENVPVPNKTLEGDAGSLAEKLSAYEKTALGTFYIYTICYIHYSIYTLYTIYYIVLGGGVSYVCMTLEEDAGSLAEKLSAYEKTALGDYILLSIYFIHYTIRVLTRKPL